MANPRAFLSDFLDRYAIVILTPALWIMVTIWLPYAWYLNSNLPDNASPLLKAAYLSPFLICAFVLEGLLLQGLYAKPSFDKVPGNPQGVHKMGAFIFCAVMPILYPWIFPKFSVIISLGPLRSCILWVWVEAAYILSVFSTFRTYSSTLGMDYGGVYSSIVARSYALNAIHASELNRPIEAHSELANAYDTTSKTLHARGLRFRKLDGIASALSTLLRVRPGLNIRSVSILGSALKQLPDWKTTAREIEEIDAINELTWLEPMLPRAHAITKRVFDVITAVSALIGGIGPVYAIIYAYYQSQAAVAQPTVAQTAIAVYVATAMGWLFLAVCFWVWARVLRSTYPHLTGIIQILVREERMRIPPALSQNGN